MSRMVPITLHGVVLGPFITLRWVIFLASSLDILSLEFQFRKLRYYEAHQAVLGLMWLPRGRTRTEIQASALTTS